MKKTLNLTDLGRTVNTTKKFKCDLCQDYIKKGDTYYYSEWPLDGGASHPKSWFVYCEDCVILHRAE